MTMIAGQKTEVCTLFLNSPKSRDHDMLVKLFP